MNDLFNCIRNKLINWNIIYYEISPTFRLASLGHRDTLDTQTNFQCPTQSLWNPVPSLHSHSIYFYMLVVHPFVPIGPFISLPSSSFSPSLPSLPFFSPSVQSPSYPLASSLPPLVWFQYSYLAKTCCLKPLF